MEVITQKFQSYGKIERNRRLDYSEYQADIEIKIDTYCILFGKDRL